MLIAAENRFRWQVALRPVPLILVVMLAGTAAFLAVNPQGPVSFDATSLLLLGIVVATVPLQSAAEELVFRGLLPQIIGGWVKSPWAAVLVSSATTIAITALVLSDRKLMATCAAKKPKSAPHLCGEEREEQAAPARNPVVSARPEMQQRAGQRPDPALAQEPQRDHQRPEQLAQSLR